MTHTCHAVESTCFAPRSDFLKTEGYGTLFCFQRLTRTSYQMPSCGKGSLPAANRILREDRLLMEVSSEPDGEKVIKRRSCVKHDHVLITHARPKSWYDRPHVTTRSDACAEGSKPSWQFQFVSLDVTGIRNFSQPTPSHDYARNGKIASGGAGTGKVQKIWHHQIG